MPTPHRSLPASRPALWTLPWLALAIAPAAQADTTAELDPIVVTATATQRHASDAPASVSVISREQLQMRPVLDLADALRGSTGVTISGVGMGRRGIRIRGMDPSYTLVLLDGRRVSAASNAIAHADFDMGWLPASAIERIEVVRGPMSSLYGSEALGGVVNVISRAATDDWRGEFTYNGGVVGGGRGGGTTQAAVYAGGALRPGTLGMQFIGEHRRKELTRDPHDLRLSEQEGRGADTGTLTLSWTPDDAQRIELSHLQGKEKRWRDALQSGTPSYVYENVDDIRRSQTTLSHRGEWAWGQTRINAYRSTLDRANRRSRGEVTRPQSLTDDIVDGQATVTWSSHRISAGGEWRREHLQDSSAARSGQVQAIHAALFLQDEMQLGEHASLVLGNRADHHPQFGWHHSPRAYAVWQIGGGFTLKGGAGSGFKAPTLKQLSPEYSAVGGGGRFTIYGNPALKPEQNTSYELGAGWSNTRGTSLQATVFQNELKDLIQTRCVAACGVRGREVRNYTNVSRARIRGLELNGSLPLPAGFALDANYSGLRARDLQTGLALNERPRHSGATDLRWESERLSTSLRSEYVGSQFQLSGTRQVSLPAYWRTSLDARYRITDTLSVSAGVDNLADKRLDESSALYPYAETGRYWHAGINLVF